MDDTVTTGNITPEQLRALFNFKVKISGVATVTNPPMSEFVMEELKARYRKGLPDLPDYPLDTEIKRALDLEASRGAQR